MVLKDRPIVTGRYTVPRVMMLPECCQTQTGRLRTSREDLPEVRARTSGGNKDKDNDDDQGGDIPAWMFRRSNQKTEKSAPKERDSKKKPAQPKENVDRARRNTKVKEGATEEKCVAGPVVTRAQVKKSNKVHLLKVKEAMCRQVDY